MSVPDLQLTVRLSINNIEYDNVRVKLAVDARIERGVMH